MYDNTVYEKGKTRQKNLYIGGGGPGTGNYILSVDGELGNNSKFGITMQNPGVFTNSENTDYNDRTKFVSDATSHMVVHNDDRQLMLADAYEISAVVQDYVGVYDGQKHGVSVFVTDPASGALVEYGEVQDICDKTELKYKNVGNYTVYYEINADEYKTKTGLAFVRISEAPLTIEKAVVAEKIYDGTADAEVKELTIGGLKNGETLEEGKDYTVTAKFDNTDATGDNAAKEVTVTVTLLDTEKAKNYSSCSTTFSQKINKANPTYDNHLSFTTKEGKKLKDLTLPTSDDGVYTWLENPSTPVGSAGENIFHVNYTPNDTNNYNVIYDIPVAVTVTAKKVQDLEFENKSIIKVYEDGNFTQTVSGAATDVTYTSSETDVADVNANTGEVTIKRAGVAIIKAVAVESEDYAKSEAEYVLVVDKKGVSVPIAKPGLIYNGEEQTGVELPADAVYTLIDNVKKDAGDYKAVASLNDKNNYRWDVFPLSSNDQIIGWSVAKKNVNVKADNKTSNVGEKLVELTFTNENLFSGDNFVGKLETQANSNKEGDYPIIQGTLSAGNNYEIEFTPGVYTVTSTPTPQPAPSPHPKSDVSPAKGGEFSWNVIEPELKEMRVGKTLRSIKIPDELKTRKYINGYEDKTFRPEQNITRAETAQTVYKLMYKGENINYDVLEKYSDVETGKWYSKAIAYLAEKNIINGSDGKYNPESPITRAETAQILLNILKSYDTNTKNYSYGSNSYNFSDVDGWYSETVKQLASIGIINGYADKTFRPNEKIKRSEFVAMIAKVFGRDVENTSGVQKFSDVPSDYLAVKYINDAAE